MPSFFLGDESDCWFVKDVCQHWLHITVVNDRRPPPIVYKKRKARLIRRSSCEGEHREVLVLSVPATKQILVVVEGKERVIRLKKRITRDFYSDNTEPFPMPA